MKHKDEGKSRGRRWIAVLCIAIAVVVITGAWGAVMIQRLNKPNVEAEPWCTPDGVTISILGDSISTFSGYIPRADGVNLAHETFYPHRSVNRVEHTWWAQVIDRMGGRLGVNESWSGSRVLNTMDGNDGYLGEDAAMASMTRIRNLGSNGDPEIILFFGGTNDISFGSPLGEFDAVTAPVEADLTATKWDTFADAYVTAILRMKHLYPAAQIYALSPVENLTYYDEATRGKFVAVMKEICHHYGVPFIDLTAAGFTAEMLCDGTHPDREGMACIADIVTAALQE